MKRSSNLLDRFCTLIKKLSEGEFNENNDLFKNVITTIQDSLSKKYIFSEQERYFQRDDSFFSLLGYLFSLSINDERFESCLDTIFLILSYYKGKEISFFSEIVKCLLNIMKGEKIELFNCRIIEKKIKINCEKNSNDMFVFFEILKRALDIYTFFNINILELAYYVLKSENQELHLRALELLVKKHFVSIQDQVQIIRIIMHFIFYSLKDHQYLSDVDNMLNDILSSAINTLPNSFANIFGNYFISYLSVLKPFSKCKFVDNIFYLIKKYIKSDYQIINACTKIFISYFSDYFENAAFLKICKLLATENIDFKKIIWEKYHDQIILFPSLIDIGIIENFPFEAIIKVDDIYLKYQIVCSLLKQKIKMPAFVLENIKNQLQETLPLNNQIHYLTKFIPSNLFEYKIYYESPDIIYRILKENDEILNKNSNNQNFINYLLKNNNIKLISLFLKYNPSVKYAFTEIFINHVFDFSMLSYWKNKYFLNIFNLFCNDDITNSFFDNFLKSNNLNVFLYIAKEKKLWSFFSKQICRNLISGNLNVSRFAHSILIKIDNINEIFQENSFLFGKYYIKSIQNKTNKIFENIITLLPLNKFQNNKFESFANIIVPLCISKNDENNLLFYYKKCKLECKKQKSLKLEELLLNNICYIVSYLFLKNHNQQSLSFSLLEQKIKKKITEIIDKKRYAYEIFSLLLVFYAKKNIKTHNGIVELYSLINPSDNNNNFDDIIIKLLNLYFSQILMNFSHYIANNDSYKSYTIKALISLIKYLNNDHCSLLLQHYPKIYSILSSALTVENLQKDCLIFWNELLLNCENDLIICNLFGPIISQVLPYFKKYPNEVISILYILIKEKKNITCNYFKYVSFKLLNDKLLYSTNFSGSSKSIEIKKILESQNNGKDKNSIVNLLSQCENNQDDFIIDWCEGLQNATPCYKIFLLKQILKRIKKNPKEVEKLNGKKHLNTIWKVYSNDTDEKIRILCSRVMCFMLDFIREKYLIEENYQFYETKNEIIIHLITDFLVKCFEDSNSVTVHDHAVYSIQKLLIKLGLFENENYKENKNWNDLPTRVQNLIQPYLNNKLVYRKFSKEDSINLPVCDNTKDLNTWLYLLTKYFIDNDTKESIRIPDYYKNCKYSLCDSPDLCRYILQQILIHQAKNKNTRFIEDFQKEINQLVSYTKKNKFEKNNNSFSKQALGLIFSIFSILNQKCISPGNSVINKKWICMGILPEIKLAKVCIKCKLYIQALIYIELALHEKLDEKKMQKMRVYSHKIFKKIDDQDSLAFFEESNDIDDLIIQVEKKALQGSYNANYYNELAKKEFENGRYERSLADSMFIRSLHQQDIKSDGILARSALRLQRWDIIRTFDDDIAIKSSDFQSSVDIMIAKLLYYNHINDFYHKKKLSKQTQKILYMMLSNVSYVSYQSILPILSQFRLVEEISEPKLLLNHNLDTEIPLKSAEIERISSIHNILASEKDISLELDQVLQLSKFYIKNGEISKCKLALSRCKLYIQDTIEYQLEKAKIQMCSHQYDSAILILKNIKNSNANRNDKISAKINYLLAKFSNMADSLPLEDVKKLYLEASKYNKQENGKIFYQIASLYDNVITKYYHNLKKENQSSNTTKKSIGRRNRKRTAFTDNQNSTTMTNFISTNLPDTIINYMKAIIFSPHYSHEVLPRVLSLIFDIGSYLSDLDEKSNQPQKPNIFLMIDFSTKDLISTKINEAISKIISKVPTNVWLSSITQLISRIEQKNQFQAFIFSFIKPTIEEYPLSVLWHLMSTKNSKSHIRQEKFEELWNNVNSNLLNQQKNFLLNTKENYFTITNHLINFIKEKKFNSKNISADMVCPLLKKSFQEFEILMPITRYMLEKYDSSHSIVSMDDLICVLPSKQKPKKIKLIAKNGISNSFLVKIDDDLRKDMRMMEFVSFMNGILHHDRRCLQRNLSLSTFTVICLNEECGIIEWIDNTIQFRKIVEENLHEQGITLNFGFIKEKLYSDCPISNNINQKKQYNFTNVILPSIPPVLYLWFLSEFRQPSLWYQAKLTYIHSVSVWSMIGYIVGLGDRHAENILFQEKTGACLHVDFACLFDKAKTLEIPEIVPFRLTQNIVDAMGVLKTKGPFSLTCQYTMELMKTKKNKILSVLQTFVHDPLLEWKNSNETGENQAISAIMEVKRRLSCLSEDRSTIQSPKSVVDQLIEEATDNNKLALMFVGWQPFY